MVGIVPSMNAILVRIERWALPWKQETGSCRAVPSRGLAQCNDMINARVTD
jgi:hypothetical protein